MQKTRLLVAVLILASVTLSFPGTKVEADPSSDIWTHYYDCALNQVGEKFRGCGSLAYNQGTLSGYYKEIEACSCEGSSCSITWYVWNGTGWTYIGTSTPSPAC